jgi:DNA-binding response OmpR family regulator
MNRIVIYGTLVLDRARFLCLCDGVPIQLRNIEFNLLEMLMMSNGRVVTRTQIANKIWGEEKPVRSRVIDSHICNLRKILSMKRGKNDYIIMVRGLGYKFNIKPPEQIKIIEE